jgi:hypothetical protein
MDIDELTTQFGSTCLIVSIQEYLEIITDAINEAGQLGFNSLVYELIVLDLKDIQQIRNELLTLFPDMIITIYDKRLVIDWS